MSGFGKKGNLIILVFVIMAGLFILERLRMPPAAEVKGHIIRSSAHFQEAITKEAVIDCTNEERETHGRPHLSENEYLNAIAEERARDMLEKQYFAHVSPTGEQASDIARKVGYAYKIIAENIASGHYPTNQNLVDGWMQSPGHRKNILSPDVKEIGVAIIEGNLQGRQTTIGVQIFGLESPPVSLKTCTAPPEELVREIETKREEINSLKRTLNRISNELEEERQSIESDRNLSSSNSQGGHDLNVRIQAYNEKSEWNNRMVTDAQAKIAVLKSMINEYNRAVKDYKDCHNSDNQD